jgi:F-type H+-transporting ATPase subunit b
MDTFYVGVGFVIFLGILYKVGAFRMLAEGLDARGKKISEQLNQAARLRADAEKLLAEYEAKRMAAEVEAKRIVDEAKAEAERIRMDQETKLADFVTRRTKLAEQKIAQAELSATAEVKAAAADAAIKAAEVILRGQATGKTADDLISAGLSEVKQRLN